MESFVLVSLIKEINFPFSIVTMPEKSSNVPSSIVYSAIGAESLRIARASNNPESFSTAIKPLIACMSRQGVPIQKINSSILNFFNKHHSDFNNVCQSKQEFLNLISKIINTCILIHSGQPIKTVAIARQIRR